MLMYTFVALSLYLHQYYEVGQAPVQFESVMCTGYIVKMAVTSVMLFLMILTAFAQIYNGVNSYDQVILGFLLGSYLAFYLHFRFKIMFKFLQVRLATSKKKI